MSAVADTMTAIPSQSVADLDKLERKHAENPEGRYFVPLANAYRKVGDVDRAISVLRSGLETHPDYVSAHIVLGQCLVDRGDVDSAFGEFLRVLSLDSQNLVALPEPYIYGSEQYMTSEAAHEFQQMVNAAALDGVYIFARSSYRSYETQIATYNFHVANHGQEYAERLWVRGDHSPGRRHEGQHHGEAP
jgi:tetratricopeptide (TPR) repeat protein